MKNNDFYAEQTFVSIANNPMVKRTALKVALIVGSILCLINHLPAMLDGTFNGVNLVQVALTYTVPYCVSTYSSVRMIRRFCITTSPEA